MSDSVKGSEFEKILNAAYDLAVKHQHEYVTTEHLLAACLSTGNLEKIVTYAGGNFVQLRQDIADFLADPSKHSVVEEARFQPKYTSSLLTLVKQAKTQSMFLGKNTLDSVDLLIAIFNAENSWAVYFLRRNNVSKENLAQAVNQMVSDDSNLMSPHDAQLILGQFAVNLNQRAKQNKIDPLIGRHVDVQQIVETLARKHKNNVLLVGNPGTGKTQIVEGLAKKIVEHQVPATLADKEIWSLDVSSVVAGTKFRGDFEERMKNLLTALRSLPNVILFIDEIHMIMGAGNSGGQGSMDVANILKPALGRGEVRTIGSTTHEEYRKHFEKDRALLRRFQKQDVAEPSSADAKLILAGLLPSFSRFHGVGYQSQVVDAAVDLSVKFVHDRYLPDKAIDLIDAAGAAAKVQGAQAVSVADIHQQLSKMARISVDAIEQKQTDINRDLQHNIEGSLFGQKRAVVQVVETVWTSLSGLRENSRTMASFLFSGPSGTGKTELARLLAQNLHYQFVRFDMSEFQERHTVSRLIGSPPGYVGYSDGNAGSGALINALEQNPQCVLLMDEIEKAHPDIVNIFLQAMDRGVITSANQKSVSLQNVILIFTSNLGAADMERSPVGFARASRQGEDTAAIRQFFAPEFRNRLDGIVAFDKLSSETCNQIVDKFVHQLAMMCEAKNVKITVDPTAKGWLATNGFDPSLGARPLARCIDNNIKKPLAKEMLFGRLVNGGSVLVTVDSSTQALKLEYLSKSNSTSGFDLLTDALVDMEMGA